MDVVGQLQAELGGVVGPLVRAFGGRFDILVAHGAVVGLAAIHIHEAVAAHFGSELHAAAVRLYVFAITAIGRPVGGQDDEGHAGFVADTAQAFGRSHPVEGQSALPALPARFGKPVQGRLQLGILPAQGTVGELVAHVESPFCGALFAAGL